MSQLWKKYTNKDNPHSIAVGVLSLLDHCYARGVRDACNSKDEMLCREFIDKTDKPGVFGFLWKDRDSRYDLNTWSPRQFITEMMNIAVIDNIQNRNKLFMFLSRIINPSTYHFCLLHIAQEFYKQGILDYLKYPNHAKLYTILDTPTNKIWESNGAKRKNRKYTLFRLQNACNDRALRSEEAIENGDKNKFATKRVSFINFQKSIWNALNGFEFLEEEELRGRPRKEQKDG